MKEVEIFRLVLNEKSPQQTVYLRPKGEYDGRVMPVVIGIFEANAIQMGLFRIDPGRPLTHDLILGILDALQIKPVRMVINMLHKGTFYALLRLETERGPVDVDCRPSDAMALAARKGFPVFVEDEVFEQAAVEDPLAME